MNTEPSTFAVAPAGFTVRQWLQQVPIGATTLYDLWRKGEGPHRTRVGGKVIIIESGADYLARLNTSAGA